MMVLEFPVSLDPEPFQDNISDLSFHPEEELVALGTIGGDLSVFR